jgi:drug/metabolite transporter (DMT)-like permease
MLLGFLRYFPAGMLFLPNVCRRFTQIATRDWPPIIALGCLFYGIYPWLFSAALKYTTALHAALILPLLPMFTLLLAATLGREALTRQKSTGIALALVGVTIAFAEDLSGGTADADEWEGDALLIAGLVLSATFNVLSGPYILRYSALTVTSMAMFAGSIALLAMVSLSATLAMPSEFDIFDWALVLFLSFGGAALANYLWIVALGLTVASRVAMFALLTPIVAAVMSPLVLGEAPSAVTLVGGLLVVGGIVVSNRGRA